MARGRQRRRPMGEINVVPYIDVMLVLLVIFMITAPLLTQGVKVDLPQADAEQVDAQSVPPLVVSVDREGRYHLEHGIATPRLVTPAALGEEVMAVLAEAPATPVYVKGDRDVAYGTVVQAMVRLQQAGAPTVGLLTEAPETGQ